MSLSLAHFEEFPQAAREPTMATAPKKATALPAMDLPVMIFPFLMKAPSLSFMTNSQGSKYASLPKTY